MENNKFNFWVPAEIEKSVVNKKTKQREMYLKGIASTDALDLDGQVLQNGGFVTSYLMERGLINWHHQAKNDPAAIIGEPVEAKITKAGLFIKGKIYDTPTGRKAYETTKVLQDQSSTRRMGWSIEGKVIEKEGNRIKKALLTGVALTHAPKNASTFAEVAKAFEDEKIAEELLTKGSEVENNNLSLTFKLKNATIYVDPDGKVHYIDKALQAGSLRGFEGDGGSPLKKESLERKVKVIPPRINTNLLTRILRKHPKLDLHKALKVHDKLVQNN